MRVHAALPSAICEVRDSRFLGLDSRPSVAGLHPGTAASTSPSRCLGTPSSLHQSRVQLRQGGTAAQFELKKGQTQQLIGLLLKANVPAWCLTDRILLTLPLSFLEGVVLTLLDEWGN